MNEVEYVGTHRKNCLVTAIEAMMNCTCYRHSMLYSDESCPRIQDHIHLRERKQREELALFTLSAGVVQGKRLGRFCICRCGIKHLWEVHLFKGT